MRRYSVRRGGRICLLLLLAPSILLGGRALAGEETGPTELVHVPSNEMDVLLRADRQGIVLRYAEYERLLKAARARVESLADQPPVDGTLVSCEGEIDLTGEKAAGLKLSYAAEVLADGPRSISFPLRNLAIESLLIQDTDGAVSGRYEEWKGKPRLRFTSPGSRLVTAVASAAYRRRGEQRLLDLYLPAASAMSLSLKFPPGVEGMVLGEGAATPVRTPSGSSLSVQVRPSRGGRLRIAFAPASKGTDDGPAILDSQTNSLHGVGDGLVHSRVVVHVDVFRTPVDRLFLQVPEDFAVRSLEGKGVTGFSRIAGPSSVPGRARVAVQLEKPVMGAVVLTLEGERPYRPGPEVILPHVVVADAVRDRAVMLVKFGRDVRVRGLAVQGGKRLPSLRTKGQPPVLRYALSHAGGSLRVDLEAGAVRLDAVSTYYLNLAEAGKSLIATMTYRVLEGTVFALRPRMPGGYELRTVTINGKATGFTRDLRADGTLEIALLRGVPAGQEISLAAMLEQSQADWVPEQGAVAVPFAVPTAGAEHEEGLIGIGADAAFRVLHSDSRDLVAVGAAELTARGISAAGLVYGYRRDGAQPAVTFSVQRHEPLVEARLVTTLLPSPRRLDVLAVAAHRIRRAGVRSFFIDVPAWAGEEQVRFESPFVRGAALLKGDAKPKDVPAGYERWRIELNQRVIGRHATVVRYHDDLDSEDWSVPTDRPLGIKVPLERSERFLVVQRAKGLEVSVSRDGEDIRSIEVTELPAAAAVDPTQVLDVLRLANGTEGVGVSVRKHGGAAVLDAIATKVLLNTAVAREGVLRTRAWVHLFNVDRQFLKISLPRGSDLIGAVVDGKAVKALTDPSGVLMVPIPTARVRGQTTVASLTYETRLEEPVGGSVRVEGLILHELEVLRTEHVVAFDPQYRIESVGGDYGTLAAKRVKKRTPWVFSFLAAFAPGGGGGSGSMMTTGAEVAQSASNEPVVRDHSPFMSPMDFNTLQQNPTFETEGGPDVQVILEAEQIVEDAEVMDAPFEGPANNGTIGRGGGSTEARLRAEHLRADRAVARERQLRARLAQAEAQMSTRYRGPPPGGAVTPGQRDPSDPSPPPPPPSSGPPMTPSPSTAGADGGGGGPPRPARADRHHEGDMPPALERRDAGRRGRRKGLLSLDVPVVLGPNVVVAARLGQGGAIDIALLTKSESDHHFLWLTLGLTAVALLAGMGGRGRKGLVILGGFALAGLVAALFGRDGNTLVCALANAVFVAALAWGLGWLLSRWVNRHVSRSQVEDVALKGTSAVLLALALGLAFAPAAAADEPRPPLPNVKPPKKVFVPYDPADPTGVKQTDRVFLPLATYLELFKAAHPESDPELVKLGRMVTVLDARYEVRLEPAAVASAAAMAKGRATWRFAKRGAGTLLVRWPIAGLAVTQAKLDGEPVRLLLEKGVYRVAVTAPGDHKLELSFRVPVVSKPDGRSFSFGVPAFARARLDIAASGFDGDVYVSGAGRVERLPAYPAAQGTGWRAWLGARRRIAVTLAEKSPDELPATVRTRAESRTIHSIRDTGTETSTDVTLYVLQGRAPFVDLELPAGVTVLEAKGPKVVRWEVLAQPTPRVRLVFASPSTGALKLALRTFRSAKGPERSVDLPVLLVLETTSESGQVIVNADRSLRVDIIAASNLFRMGLPKGKAFLGADGAGRVTGAWRFAARPTRMQVRTRRMAARVDIDSEVSILFGDDRVRSKLRAHVLVEKRSPVGRLVFDIPGEDEVRLVESAGLDTWWLEGKGEERRLHLRYQDLRSGRLLVDVQLDRRLGGVRDGIFVPRWSLQGARRDRGRLGLFALPDVELKAGSVAGLKPLPPGKSRMRLPPVDGARAVHAYAWDTPPDESLSVGLREPEFEAEAVVISLVSPGDEEHRIEHLVLFDVRRGSTDHLQLFVPDGSPVAASALGDVVTTRDLREMRRTRVTRVDADGADVAGTLYDLQLQSPRDGIIEVTVSQVWRQELTRLVRPEGVSGVHWFSLVRTFLDGEVQVAPMAGQPDAAAYEDLPFVPAGLQRSDVVRSYASRTPYILQVLATRHRLEAQAEAVVQAAVATVVVGRDGQARIRMDYRIFNRARQFLTVRLPEGALLFGATTAGNPVKPLAGKSGTLLLPIPKVPLGGKGYPVSLLFRVRAGEDIQRGGALKVLLPEIVDVEVDRTVVRLFVPDGFDYDFDSSMTATNAADVAADLAEVAIREARELLKLADNGTVSQRFAASQNGLALIAHARAKLNQGAQAQDKYRALSGELNQLSKQLNKRNEMAQKDVATLRRTRSQAGPSVEEFASNARNILSLDDVTNGLEDASAAQRPGGEGKNKAGWVFNAGAKQSKTTKGQSKGKASLKKLRDRLEGKLRSRAGKEARKNFANVVQPQKSAQSAGRRVAGQQGQSLDNKQVAWLNENLKKEQTRNRQLGAVDTSLLNGFIAMGQGDAPGHQFANASDQFRARLAVAQRLGDVPALGQLFTDQEQQVAQLERSVLSRSSNYFFAQGLNDDVFMGSTANPAGVQFQFSENIDPSTVTTSRDTGIFFSDGLDRSYAARVENIFDRPLATVLGKVGLMGVDVELPQTGKIYYFRSLRAGAPIEIHASVEARSMGGRVAVLLLILAAAAVVGNAIRRRRATAAA